MVLNRIQKIIVVLVAVLSVVACVAIQINAGEIKSLRFFAKNITATPADGVEYSLTTLNSDGQGYSAILEPAKTLSTTLIAFNLETAVEGTLYYSYDINPVGATTWDFRSLNDNHPAGNMDGTKFSVAYIQREYNSQGIMSQAFNRNEDGTWNVTVARKADPAYTAYGDTFTNTLGASSSSMVFLQLKNVKVTNEGYNEQIFEEMKELNQRVENIENAVNNIGEEEKQFAQSAADSSKTQSENAFGNYFNIGENTTFWGYLQTFYTAVSGEHTLTKFKIPPGDLSIMDKSYRFWDEQYIDFTWILNDPNFSKLVIVVRGLQVLASGAMVVFYAFKIRSWIVNYDENTADISSEIPFLGG
jgi:hypothetical protein